MEFGLLCLFESPAGRSDEAIIREHIASIELAEKLGFDAAWVPEHHFSEYGVSVSPVALLSAAAMRTSRIRLGSAVIVLPLHDPIRVAEEFATLDLLSGGRIDLGVGRGFQPDEFRGYGVKLSDSTMATNDALDIIRAAWTNGCFVHAANGTVRSAENIRPRPLQRPHPPIWLAAVSEATFRKAGRQRLNLLCSPVYGDSLERIAELLSIYRDELRSAPPGSRQAHAALMTMVYVGRTDEEAEAMFREPALWQYESFFGHAAKYEIDAGSEGYETYSKIRDAVARASWPDLVARGAVVCGSVETVTAKLVAIREKLGISQLLCWMRVGGIAGAVVERSMERLAHRVMPALR